MSSSALQSILAGKGALAALTWCRERLRENPQDADAWRWSSLLHAQTQEFGAALTAATRACELAPDDPRCFSDLGRIHALMGQYAEAARWFERSLHVDPGFAEGWHNLGTALKRLGDSANAFAALKKALSIDPGRADSYLNLGNLLIDAGQFRDAVECYERAARHDPRLALARGRLANELSARGKVRQAENLFRQALGLDPEDAASWFGLGRTLEDLGEAEAALGCYLKTLEREPRHAAALGNYLALVREAPAAQILPRARDLFADASSADENRALVGYGLLKYYDRHKDHAEAARIGLLANAARRRQAGTLDRAALTARVDDIIAHYTSDFFAQRREYGDASTQPVFIIGLPRSGTTLTEQILSAHPHVHGAGELNDLARLASQSAGAQPVWQAARLLDEKTTRDCAEDYLAALRENAPAQSARICDKTPLNFFQLAFAALLFPQAQVVHCVRDARDNALSIWMENFNPDQRYATDFSDLAFHRRQYLRLMAHWRKHLPLAIHEMRYEDTVADLDAQARGVVAFLGLPWNDACLEFHRNARAVQTPSRWQVRQPIYSRSVERWREYASWLPDLATAFEEFATNGQPR